jgi:hypothetical protein
MSTTKNASRLEQIIRIAVILGPFLYVASFFLPICGLDAADALAGWKWAWASFLMAAVGLTELGAPANTTLFGHPLWIGLFSFMSGSINLLVPIYLWLRSKARARITRVSVVAVLLICVAASWPALQLLDMTPFFGYYVWIAGVLLITTRELGPQQQPQAA